jgi:hypothetical protein
MESSQEEFLRLLDPSFYNASVAQGDSFGAAGPVVNGAPFLDANANDVDDLFKWQTIDFNFPPATDVTTTATTTFNPSKISAGSVNPVLSAGKALKASRADFDFTTTGQDSATIVSTSAVNDNDVQEVKRKRNCEASARFRQKKKQREQETEMKMKELSTRNEYLEMRVLQLEQETKWLRGLLLEKIPTAPTNAAPVVADVPEGAAAGAVKKAGRRSSRP